MKIVTSEYEQVRSLTLSLHLQWGALQSPKLMAQHRDQHCENHASRLILKHLRQRGLLKAFQALRDSLPSTSALRLEDPAVTAVHRHLVELGDFDEAEDLLTTVAYPDSGIDGTSEPTPSLFDAYCQSVSPRVQWTRLDSLPGTATWDGESPSPRGGHQMVLVRSRSIETPTGSECHGTNSAPYLYLYGGWNGTTELADLWRFDLHEQRWELLSTDTSADIALGSDGARIFGPDPRSCHQMAVDQDTGDIYMLGRFVDPQVASRQSMTGLETLAGLSASSDPHSVEGQSFAAGTEGVPPTSTSRNRETSDFWVLHTRGALSGTWQLLSDNVEVS